ncbi:MAG: NHL repeat-containing protein [Cyclobacteriaceae bacterium]
MVVRYFIPSLRGVRCAIGVALLIFLIGSCQEQPENSDPVEDDFLVVSTLAGSDNPGLVDGIGPVAKFNNPSGMVLDPSGNLYVSDHSNHCIRKITPRGIVSTFAGTGQAGFENGYRTNATFNHPYGLAMDSKGNLYVGDVANHGIRKISADGMVSTLAGGRKGFSDREGDLAMFNHPYGVAVDSKNNVYVADSYNNRIRKITPDGSVSTLAGNGYDGFVDGKSSEAEFFVPIGIVADKHGNIYVGDEGNSSIRKISATGKVTTLAGNGKFSFCDGIGKNAEFNAPGAISIDGQGNLYVADYLNNCIRRVSPAGEVRKIAGNLEKGFADGAPQQALFYYPFGIAVDPTGIVYVGDHFNHRIRKIN